MGLSSESTREPVPEVERAHVAMSRPDPEPTPVCIIRGSAQLEDMEQRLKFALVAYVGGARPFVSREQAE